MAKNKYAIPANRVKTIDGVGFYPEAFEGKTEAQFVKEQSHHELTPDQLKAAYAKLTGKPAEAKK